MIKKIIFKKGHTVINIYIYNNIVILIEYKFVVSYTIYYISNLIFLNFVLDMQYTYLFIYLFIS